MASIEDPDSWTDVDAPISSDKPVESSSSCFRIPKWLTETVQKIRNWVNTSRIFYVLSRPVDSWQQLPVSKALSVRQNNQAFKDVTSVHSGSGVSVYPNDNSSDPFGINKELAAAKTRYLSFNLPTTHRFLGLISGSHNVSVLYDKQNRRLYVIDGNANDPETLHFEDRGKKPCEETVAGFVKYLQTELGVAQGNTAYCKRALQRTNDCVIFPEKVMAELIKKPSVGNQKVQGHLDDVLKLADEDASNFYGEINALRNKCLDLGKANTDQ